MYLDLASSPQLTGMYEGIQITNTSGSNYSDLWAQAQNFSGPEISLAPNENGIYHIGPLASGATTWAWFYLNAAGSTSTAETHNIDLYDTIPSLAPSPLCAQTFSLTASTDIAASANKVTSVVSGPTPPEIGGVLTITYSGATGTIGAANIFATTPATFANWPADVFRLKDVNMTINGVTFDHSSYTTAETGGNYSVTATFVSDGSTTAPTSVSPVSHISSGTQVKHTDTSSSTYTALQPLSPTSNTLSVQTSSSPGSLGGSGGTSTITVTISNSGGESASLDQIAAALPASPGTPVYVPGSTTFNGVGQSDPSQSGKSLVWPGTWTVPAEVAGVPGTSKFTFTLNYPSTSGVYKTSITGGVGSYTVGDSTSSSSPAVDSEYVNVAAAPTTSTASYRLDANSSLSVAAPGPLAGDTGSSVTVTSYTAPSHGKVSMAANGAFTYTPDTSYSGNDSFTYVITDSYGRTATGSVELAVYPVAALHTYSAVAGSVLSVPAPGLLTGDTGTSISVLSVGSPSHGSVTFTKAGAFTYTPAIGWTGADTFSYKIIDATGYTATNSITVTTSASLSSTSSFQSSQTQSVSAGGSLTLSLAAPRVGGPFTYLLVSPSIPTTEANITLDSRTGQLTITPAPGFSGRLTFVYEIVNAQGKSVGTDSLTVEVLGISTTQVPVPSTGAVTPVYGLGLVLVLLGSLACVYSVAARRIRPGSEG